MCMYSVFQLCPTFCGPVDCSPLGSSIHGILWARILECGAIPTPEALPNPGIQPRSPALQLSHCGDKEISNRP